MTEDRAKDAVKERMEDYLRGRGINPRKPFLCLNPEHNDRSPSMSYDPRRNKVHCFSCGADYDVIDLISIETGKSGREAFLAAYDYFHIDVEGVESHRAPAPFPKGQVRTSTSRPEEHQIQGHQSRQEEKAMDEKQIDYTQYFRECEARIDGAADYLESRGISLDTARRFHVGYDPAFSTRTAAGAHANLPMVIFPTSSHSFNARNTDPAADKKDRYRKNAGAAGIFNGDALKGSEPVFICEGEFDALSIIEAGGSAIGLSGTTGARKLLGAVEREKATPPLLILMDNDPAGQEAKEELTAGLDRLGVTFKAVNLEGEAFKDAKDANDALQLNRAALQEFVKAAQDVEREERDAYNSTAVSCIMQSFRERMEANEKAPKFSTGFESVDKILDGGLYAGLYFIGAISSLGKTTFALQLMDNLAKSGQDVLIFSLEMSKDELIAKSISRLTLLEDLEKNGSTAHAKTTRGILNGYNIYPQEDREIIDEAEYKYCMDYADNIFIEEGVGNIGVKEIRAKIEKHIRLRKKRPAVLIDYLQILAPDDPRATDKQIVDKNVMELKRISRDFKLPIVGISSFNRDNYASSVNMASFKESGSIEYSSDVLIGLQYAAMGDLDSQKTDTDRRKKAAEIREEAYEAARSGKAQTIEVKILKNRNGSKSSAKLEFYPMFNYFGEVGETAGLDDYEELTGEDEDNPWIEHKTESED